MGQSVSYCLTVLLSYCPTVLLSYFRRAVLVRYRVEQALPKLSLRCIDEVDSLSWVGGSAATTACVQAVLAQEEIGLFPDDYRTLAEFQLKNGQLEDTHLRITDGISYAQQNQDRYLEAYAWRVATHIHQAGQNQAEAQQAAQRAREMFTELHLGHEVAKIPYVQVQSSNHLIGHPFQIITIASRIEPIVAISRGR